MKIIFLFFFLLLPVQLVAATPQETLAEANGYFHQAMEMTDTVQARTLFEKALLRYEKLYVEHDSPRLAYNIGNSYFRLGELGRAIVYYRRAEIEMAADENVLHNLNYLRSLRQDQLESGAELSVLQQVLQWHRSVDYILRLQLLAVFYLLFWFSLTLRLSVVRTMPAWLPIFMLFIALMLSTSVGLQRFSPPQQAGVIVAPEVVARQGDGNSYEPSFSAPLHDGTEFVLLDRRSRWLQVELVDGRRCWLPTRSCELI